MKRTRQTDLVLRCFTEDPDQAWRPYELVRPTGLHRNSVQFILTRLVDVGWLIRYRDASAPGVFYKLTAEGALGALKLLSGGEPGWRHGTNSGYQSGCRCGDCRQAHTADHKQRRQAWAQKDPAELTHGRASTYYNYHCRCEVCTEAALARWRAYEARVKAARAS